MSSSKGMVNTMPAEIYNKFKMYGMGMGHLVTMSKKTAFRKRISKRRLKKKVCGILIHDYELKSAYKNQYKYLVRQNEIHKELIENGWTVQVRGNTWVLYD